eukprot:s5033_g11.t1
MESHELAKAMARLVLRHEEQINALASDVCFVSCAKTDEHSALPKLHMEHHSWKCQFAPANAPNYKMILTLTFFRELRDRLVTISKDQRAQDHLKTVGHMTPGGEWPYLEYLLT